MTAIVCRPPTGPRIVLRPPANPLPLGFLALAGGTLVVSGLQLGWVPAGEGQDVGLILLAFSITTAPGSTSDALGLLLLIGGAGALVAAAAAASGKLVPALVLTTAGLRFAITGIHQLSASSTWEDIAGVVGLVLCALALYAALAGALEDAEHRTVLPLGRRGYGQAAVEAEDLATQLHGVANEAGVRERL